MNLDCRLSIAPNTKGVIDYVRISVEYFSITYSAIQKSKFYDYHHHHHIVHKNIITYTHKNYKRKKTMQRINGTNEALNKELTKAVKYQN